MLFISDSNLNSDVNTKRKLLAETAKVFDPLNFALPVTIKGRILLRFIWTIRPQVDWDQPISADTVKVCKKLITDLKLLPRISFPGLQFLLKKLTRYNFVQMLPPLALVLLPTLVMMIVLTLFLPNLRWLPLKNPFLSLL